jgi:glutathione S-transferase
LITLHHLENSRSQRILWLLEELGLDYTIVRYKRDPQTSLAPPELEAIHPLGKSPVITDGELTVAESGAIIEYLLDTYDETRRLRPASGTPERLQYTYWLHYAEGSFMPLMIISLLFSRIESAPMPFFIKPIARGIVAKVREGYLDRNVQKNLRFMENTLATSDWFAGATFSGADVQMSFPVEAAAVRANVTEDYPALAEFLARIHARPAYQRALDKGGPYELLGAGKKS